MASWHPLEPHWHRAAAFVLVLAAGPVLAGAPLDAHELRREFTDRTASGVSDNGNDFHVYHSPDGSMSGSSSDGRYRDSGEWEIRSGGKYCRKWKIWRDGRRDCFAVFRQGDLFTVEGRTSSVFRMRPGNPENL